MSSRQTAQMISLLNRILDHDTAMISHADKIENTVVAVGKGICITCLLLSSLMMSERAYSQFAKNTRKNSEFYWYGTGVWIGYAVAINLGISAVIRHYIVKRA